MIRLVWAQIARAVLSPVSGLNPVSFPVTIRAGFVSATKVLQGSLWLEPSPIALPQLFFNSLGTRFVWVQSSLSLHFPLDPNAMQLNK